MIPKDKLIEDISLKIAREIGEKYNLKEDDVRQLIKKLGLGKNKSKPRKVKNVEYLGGTEFFKLAKKHNCKSNFELREKIGDKKFRYMSKKIIEENREKISSKSI